MKAGISLATIYNTLHDFYEKGLLKKLMINSERIYFDTNTEHHHHFYSKKDQKLIDINVDMKVSGLPKPPKNKKINKIDKPCGKKIKLYKRRSFRLRSRHNVWYWQCTASTSANVNV